jgi:hypothetical protein
MTGTAGEPTTAPTTLASELLLARLLPPTKRPPAPAQVRTDVARFFRDPFDDERWQDLIDGLVQADLLTTRPLRLTEAGRARALDFLGIRDVPARCNWGTIQAKFLVPKALSLAPTAPDSLKKMAKEENLAAILLKRRFELAVGPSPSLGEVLEALACRELQFPEAVSFDEVERLVLSRLIKSEEPLAQKDLNKALPRVLLEAKRGGIAGLREVLLATWADGASPTTKPVPQAESVPLPPPVEEPVPAEFVVAEAAGRAVARRGLHRLRERRQVELSRGRSFRTRTGAPWRHSELSTRKRKQPPSSAPGRNRAGPSATFPRSARCSIWRSAWLAGRPHRLPLFPWPFPPPGRPSRSHRRRHLPRPPSWSPSRSSLAPPVA